MVKSRLFHSSSWPLLTSWYSLPFCIHVKYEPVLKMSRPCLGQFHGGGGRIHYSKKLKEHVDIMIFIERYPLTPSLRRLCIHAIFFVGQRVNTHSVFWELGRKPCQHATRGCDKRWMTCIHAGVSRSPREHASVPTDKRHCRQGMSERNGMSEWIFA